MKSHLRYSIILWFLLLGAAGGAPPAKNAADWKKEPLLISINKATQGIIAEYELWSEEWTKSEKKSTEKDKTINRMGEAFFITLIHALEVAPNPDLAIQSARFLDTKIPAEFDDMWKFVFIEFTNVARDKEGRPLESEHLANLKRRATNAK